MASVSGGAHPDGGVSLEDKVCLVTGATNGIGLAAARALARMGATVWIHGRDAARGQLIVEQLRRESGAQEVRFAQADFARLEDVRRLAAEVEAGTPQLDVLIHNAGLICPRRMATAEGIELTFAVNHLAPFLLTRLLLGKLERSAPARIVVVASEAHRRMRLDFDELAHACAGHPSPQAGAHYSMFRAYGRSKLANILFTRALSSRIAGTGVTVNALHPGVVRTGLFNHASPLARLAVAAVGRFFMISPQEGATTSVYLAVSPEVEGSSGGYYSRCRKLQPSAAASSDGDAERLWEISSRLVGLPPD